MNSTVLKWIAGVASGLCALAVVALLNTWADVRQMKASFEESKANAIKAERIATLEADVRALQKEDVEIDERIKTLWRVRVGQPEH